MHAHRAPLATRFYENRADAVVLAVEERQSRSMKVVGRDVGQ
jgi:hypothetical protein